MILTLFRHLVAVVVLGINLLGGRPECDDWTPVDCRSSKVEGSIPDASPLAWREREEYVPKRRHAAEKSAPLRLPPILSYWKHWINVMAIAVPSNVVCGQSQTMML
jgi:hypothetical protein